MAHVERIILEEIAVDMVLGSMQYMYPEARTEAQKQVQTLTDAELIAFITE